MASSGRNPRYSNPLWLVTKCPFTLGGPILTVRQTELGSNAKTRALSGL